MSTMEERTTFAKLEALKDIRGKTIALEKVRMRLIHDLGTFESEDKALQEYRRELELLQQEKMAHVEELRQIHSDINAMETIIKQAEEAKRNSQDSARKMIEEFRPLKQEVDLMRTELLGLEKLPDLSGEEKEKIGCLGLMMIMDKPKYSMEQWHAQVAAAAHHHQQQQQQLVAAAAAAHHHAAAAAAAADDKVFAAASLMARQGGAAPHVSSHGGPASVVGPPPPTNPFLAAAAAQHSAMGLGPLQLPGVSKSLTAQAGPPVPPPPPFRQQPPPMKSCLSCHQQIHRNAPICPLCKAKSRSRNPKKPKKRD